MISGLTNPSLIHLDSDSVINLCGPSKQAMVYGFTHCGYGAICKKLSDPGSCVERLFDCGLGNFDTHFKTLEGRVIEQIKFEISQDDTPEENVKICNRMCKSGITNLVLENYKRKCEGLPLIPVIFCIDSDAAPMDSTRMASRQPELNQLLTHHELRRAYKLCCEVNDPTIAAIAQETFKFAKLCSQPEEGLYSLRQIEPCWERDGEKWQKAWGERMATKKPLLKKKISWKKELQTAINRYKACSRLTKYDEINK